MERIGKSADKIGASLDRFGAKFGQKMDSYGEKMANVVDKAIPKTDDRSTSDKNALLEPLRIPSEDRRVSVMEDNATYNLMLVDDERNRSIPTNDIYRAASTGHARALESLVAWAEPHEIQSYLEFVDPAERTPLLIACSNGHLDCVRILLDRGANHFAVDADGNTALHAACMYGHVAVVNLLLSHPARRSTPYILNKKGLSALRLARMIVQTKKDGWTAVAKCIEALEQRCKVFEGWIYHRSQSMFAWQSWEARYALILRTGSAMFLEMHLFDVKNGLRTPIPNLVFDIDVHKPVTLYREGDGLNRKPLAIGLENQVLAAFDDSGFEAWSYFLTTQASLAVHDPNILPTDGATRQVLPPIMDPLSKSNSLQSFSQLPPAMDAMTSKSSSLQSYHSDSQMLTPRKGKMLYNLQTASPAPTSGSVAASAPAWDDSQPLPAPAAMADSPKKKTLKKQPSLLASDPKKLDAISDFVGQAGADGMAMAATAPSLDDEAAVVAGGAFSTTREECVVCLDRTKQTVCVPCGHVAACVPCSDKLERTTRRCPVCRTEVREFVKLFLT
ncbi:Aste57867_17935 [Aphanomyces stellatus]|uniref:Aste57867_17935 protein n=1 Tax=Aphanomyces stellatus TaxID=120398 RepID=A0A485L8S0_9STRA|nr:hypothetical protein As57867_017873 [Aphanomyces stellatus]VFT94676.1 Aste57867_17935 [Aphanomyces stellatus]